jgi:hypothetical protein
VGFKISIKKLRLRAIPIALISWLGFSSAADALAAPDTAATSNFESRVAAVRALLAKHANEPSDTDQPPDRVFQWANWPNWQNWNNWNNWRNWPNWNNY